MPGFPGRKTKTPPHGRARYGGSDMVPKNIVATAMGFVNRAAGRLGQCSALIRNAGRAAHKAAATPTAASRRPDENTGRPCTGAAQRKPVFRHRGAASGQASPPERLEHTGRRNPAVSEASAPTTMLYFRQKNRRPAVRRAAVLNLRFYGKSLTPQGGAAQRRQRRWPCSFCGCPAGWPDGSFPARRPACPPARPHSSPCSGAAAGSPGTYA